MYQGLRGYKLCPECGCPMLKRGQKRRHFDAYRHANGCPLSVSAVPHPNTRWQGWFVADINGQLLSLFRRGRLRRFKTEEAAINAGLAYLKKKYPPIDMNKLKARIAKCQKD